MIIIITPGRIAFALIPLAEQLGGKAGSGPDGTVFASADHTTAGTAAWRKRSKEEFR